MIDDEVQVAATRAFDALRARKLKLVTAESCTGGLVAAAITEIPGSSEVLERGFVDLLERGKTIRAWRPSRDNPHARSGQRRSGGSDGARCA